MKVKKDSKTFGQHVLRDPQSNSGEGTSCMHADGGGYKTVAQLGLQTDY